MFLTTLYFAYLLASSDSFITSCILFEQTIRISHDESLIICARGKYDVAQDGAQQPIFDITKKVEEIIL